VKNIPLSGNLPHFSPLVIIIPYLTRNCKAAAAENEKNMPEKMCFFYTPCTNKKGRAEARPLSEKPQKCDSIIR
jgi:hypothetical protein